MTGRAGFSARLYSVSKRALGHLIGFSNALNFESVACRNSARQAIAKSTTSDS